MFSASISSNARFVDLYRFVERVATYFDYTHDDVDELQILKDLQSEANKLWNPDWQPPETIPSTSGPEAWFNEVCPKCKRLIGNCTTALRDEIRNLQRGGK